MIVNNFSDARFDAENAGLDYDPNSVTRFAEPDYYRDKIREFQVSLNQLSDTAEQMRALAALPIAPEYNQDVYDWLDAYEAKRWQFVTTAEAINAASQTANALGIRMPVLSLPQGLNAAPLAIAGVAGAVAAAAALIAWATDMIVSARAIAGRMAIIEGLSPDQQAVALKAEQEIARAQASNTPLSQIATVVKWGAIVVAGFFALQAWREANRGA